MQKKSQPLEIERKFLIEYPDTALLDELSGGNRSEISQTYLIGEKGTSERVRARTKDGVTVYTHNTKIKLSFMKRIELEDEVSKEEYEELLKRADPNCRTIEKVRYCVPHGEYVCEIDLFPFWQDKAFLEIEMPSEDSEITLPPFVTLIREVTEDNRYTNHALAIELPE
ncbi:MAG: CYTH domain-containing protein [Clostridia bacterium]|nr:CYTH domain-containing protein [Clostridia bacterium]MBQ6613976.1 CYTH domain-containing protein [Clostridia bacterium]